uniref:hypothetical protein n=1 Tax=Pseudonocardia sp. CA-138482 TaxID=3240023 RepID=UPI003F491EF9
MSVTFYLVNQVGEGEYANADYDRDALDVNMASTNARFVLEALGLTGEDMSGQLPADDMSGRVLVALGVAPEDEGVPAHALTPRVWDFGRRPGYLQDHLAQLAELARAARAHGYHVAWY